SFVSQDFLLPFPGKVIVEVLKLLFDRPDDKDVQHGLADQQADEHGDDKTDDGAPKIVPKLLEMIAERHARVREQVIGIDWFVLLLGHVVTVFRFRKYWSCRGTASCYQRGRGVSRNLKG